MTAKSLGDPKDQLASLTTTRTRWYVRHTLTPEVAASLRAARRRQGRTVQQVARQVGISTSHVYGLEQGRRAPSKAVARALWVALELGPEEAEALIAQSVGDAGWGR